MRCAEKKERFGDCRSLHICVGAKTTHEQFVSAVFPSDFYVPVTHEDMTENVLNDTCNVLLTTFPKDRIAKLEKEAGRDAYFAVELYLVEPHAVVTRYELDGGREFGDIATWTIMALIYGEAHHITKDPSRCQPYEELPTNPVDLDYMKAVHCVGNYGEIFPTYRQQRSSLKNVGELPINVSSVNHLNTGQPMIIGLPDGNLAQPPSHGRATGTLGRIRRDNELRCGVFVPDNFNSTLEESRGLVGLNVEFCRTVSAAVLNGDTNHCAIKQFLYSDKEDAYRALNNGTVDLIAGALWEFKYDFRSSDDLAGMDFSTPYFYGSESITEDLSAYTLATVETQKLFSSFVNCVVVSMIWASRVQLVQDLFPFMPLSSIFGR